MANSTVPAPSSNDQEVKRYTQELELLKLRSNVAWLAWAVYEAAEKESE